MNKGFTLIELLIVIALIALLATVGVPSMQRFVQQNRVAATANDWLTSINQARVEALKIRQRVDLCSSAAPFAASPACGGNWEDGWIIIADTDGNGTVDTVIDAHGPVSGGILMRDNFSFNDPGPIVRDNHISYDSDGFLRASSNGTINVCGDDSASTDVATSITVNITGRASVVSDIYSSIDCSTDP